MDWDKFLYAVLGGLAVLITTILAGLKGAINAYFTKWTRSIEREKRTYAQGVQKIADFHKFLEHIGKFAFVDRLLVFTGTNCGGVPDPKKPYIIKCFYGWASDPKKNPEKLYDFNLKVDYHYTKLILDLIQNGVHSVETAKMPDESQLKTYYSTEGVHSSLFYRLHISSTELIYVSIANYTKGFDELEKRSIDLTIDRIRSVLND